MGSPDDSLRLRRVRRCLLQSDHPPLLPTHPRRLSLRPGVRDPQLYRGPDGEQRRDRQAVLLSRVDGNGCSLRHVDWNKRLGR